MTSINAAANLTGGTLRRESGMALLVVLVIMLVITASSSSFIWMMNQQQTRVGARLRSAAAMAAAEAGVHRALSILESVAPDPRTPGRTWRPAAYSEALRVGALAGRFTISLVDEADGGIVITSTGEVVATTRRLRARVYFATPALLAALHGRGVVYLERHPAAMVILPYGAGIGDRPWIHIAAGRGIEFASTDVSINNPSAPIESAPGPMDAPGNAQNPTSVQAPGPVRLLLAQGAELTLGRNNLRVDVQQLKVMGVHIEGVVMHAEALPNLPEVDRSYYQGLAARNTANASLNEAAGKYV
ncbi:MAG: hypothetical protein ACRDGN_05985, partial [bacterium]